MKRSRWEHEVSTRKLRGGNEVAFGNEVCLRTHGNASFHVFTQEKHFISRRSGKLHDGAAGT